MTPIQIIDDHSMLIEYEAFEEVGKGGEKEELQQVDVIPHRVKLLVSGFDTKGLAEKKAVLIDKTFSVQKTDDNGRYVVAPTPHSAIDDFFEKVIPLRTIPDE